MYDVLEIDQSQIVGDEQLGNKPKFWFSKAGSDWLFKEARPNTGEDWSEKIAAEVAHVLSTDAAIVQLACHGQKKGSASQSFVSDRTKMSLFHGNEILAAHIPGYEKGKQYQSMHTLPNIVQAVQRTFARGTTIRQVLVDLAGYMVLDALVGNTDRHHENWGLLLDRSDDDQETGILSVAPSFDHASSLGRELTDKARNEMLARDQVAAYVRRGRGGIYLPEKPSRGANPLDLVELSASTYPNYFRTPLKQLQRTTIEELLHIVDLIPTHRMTEPAKRFSKAILGYSYESLRRIPI